MKRTLSMLLCLCMIFSLAFCLTGCGSTEQPEAAAPAEETNAPAEEEAAPVEEEAPAEEAPAEEATEIDPVQLVVASSFTAGETGGQIVTYYCERVTELSGGAITFQIYDGGTLCSQGEEFDYLQDGSIDLCLTTPNHLMSTVPFAYGVCSNVSMEDPGALMNHLLFENEETGALIAEQAAQNRNMVILGATVSGSSIIASSKPVNGIEDLANQTMGTPVNIDVYNGLGVPTVMAAPPEMYDGVSRGVYDGIIFAAAPYVTNSLYEVAPNVLYTGVYNSGQLICANLDTWNGLGEAAQEVMLQAARDTLAFSAQCYEEGESQVEDVSASVATMDETSSQELVQRLFGGSIDSVRASSANLGATEGQEIIIQAISDYLGFDVTAFAN